MAGVLFTLKGKLVTRVPLDKKFHVNQIELKAKLQCSGHEKKLEIAKITSADNRLQRMTEVVTQCRTKCDTAVTI